MKNSSDTIGNRTRDLPACSAVPQPTASPRALEMDPGGSEKHTLGITALKYDPTVTPASQLRLSAMLPTLNVGV